LIDAENSPEELLHMALPGFKLKFLAKNEVSYRCSCSRERLESVIVSLGREEVEQILKEKGKMELVCQYCRKKYEFDKDEVSHLFENA